MSSLDLPSPAASDSILFSFGLLLISHIHQSVTFEQVIQAPNPRSPNAPAVDNAISFQSLPFPAIYFELP
jgi:hypothetical protein